MPNTAFVIAADEDMIRHTVTQHFHNPSERHVVDYLDKLIQLPVRVPRAGVQEVRAYLFMLLASPSIDAGGREKLRLYLIDKLQQSWKDDNDFKIDEVLSLIGKLEDIELRRALTMADRMSPMLAYSARVQGNPRIVKQLLNVVRMRTAIARKRRCRLMRPSSPSSPCLSGVPRRPPLNFSMIRSMRPKTAGPICWRGLKRQKTPTELGELMPEPWQKYADVVKDWIGYITFRDRSLDIGREHNQPLPMATSGPSR